MFCHTLILATTRLQHPGMTDLKSIRNLINQGLAMVEYFGPEIDNTSDFLEKDMETVSESISYI